MGERIVKLPDVGEGVAEAELVEWSVSVGDMVREDAVLASVMTDKATVEIPSPADGKVVWVAGEIGEKLAVGSPLVRIEVAGEGDGPEPEPEPEPEEEGSESEALEKPRPSRRPSGPPQDEVSPLERQSTSRPRAEEAAPAAVSKREAGPVRRVGGRHGVHGGGASARLHRRRRPPRRRRPDVPYAPPGRVRRPVRPARHSPTGCRRTDATR